MNGLNMRRVLGSTGLAVTVLVVLLTGACSGNDDSSADTGSPDPGQPTATASATPTATASVEDEILADYMKYWDAYGQALLNLDAGLVEGFASGDELQRIREEVAILRSQGVALRVVVQHSPVIVEINGDSAMLLDEMVNNSFYVDPVTKDPPAASGSGEILRDTFHMEAQDGQWVVVLSTRRGEGR